MAGVSPLQGQKLTLVLVGFLEILSICGLLFLELES